jgi:vacuolar-type H+-ATPase subunit H
MNERKLSTTFSGAAAEAGAEIDPQVVAAKARAKEIVDKAELNRALRVVRELTEEVQAMKMAEHFNPNKKPAESERALIKGKPVPPFQNLGEDEYKRQALLMALEGLQGRILSAVSDLENVVMDIEASKSREK